MKSTKKFWIKGLNLFIAAGFAALVACATPSQEAPGITAQPSKPQLLVYDLELGYRLDIVEAKTTLAGDLKQAQIKVKNDWHSSLDFEYRVIWYDANGDEIDPESQAWKPVSTKSQEEVTFTTLAPNAEADDFIVHIKG